MNWRLRLDVIAAYAARFALTLVSFVLRPLPRRRKVTMITRQSDNRPADFVMLQDALRRQDPSVEVVMIAAMVPRGILPKVGYALHLLVEMYHAATSRVLVVDGYSIVASAVSHSTGLTVVQMWHALGSLKKFGLSILGQIGGRDPVLAKAMRMHAGYDIVIASSDRCRAPFAEALGVSSEKVVVAPLPRVDRLRAPEHREEAREKFLRLYPELEGKRVALFAPTFRAVGGPDTAEVVSVAEALRGVGYATVTKLHPLAPEPDDAKVRSAPGMSTQEMMMVADIFITDYSSAVFEAAVAGVPSYLYASDLDQYIENRDFYVAYPDGLGLPLSEDVDSLAQLVSDNAGGTARTSDVLDSFVSLPESGTATEHLADVVLSRVGAQAERVAL